MQNFTNDKLNYELSKLCDSGKYIIKGLEGTEKCIPYIGLYWKDVDFSDEICLGNNGDFTGFMVENKNGYLEWKLNLKESQELRKLLEDIVFDPTTPKLQSLFDLIQTKKPVGCV